MDRLQLDIARCKLGSAGGGIGQQATAMAGSELQRALDTSQRDVVSFLLLFMISIFRVGRRMLSICDGV